MRTALTYLAVIACGVFLVSGYIYWKDKTNNPVEITEKKVAAVSDSEDKEKAKKPADPALLSLTENWPKQAQEDFAEAFENGRVYKLAIVGSVALGKDDNGWSKMLKEELEHTYGYDHLEVSIFEYPVRSDQFIAERYDREVAEYNPNLVLFEPFNANDNGNISTEDNHENTMKFISTLEKETDQAVVIIQPPHPFVSSIYPEQIGELKEFADEEHLTYLDHWQVWPETDDEELRSYVLTPASAPNEKGHQVWFEYLKEYFIAE